MVDIREYRTKVAIDMSVLSHIAGTVGSMAAIHVGANAALKPFLAGKLGGNRVQQFLAEKGFRHGFYENKKLHPLVNDTIKQVVSPELMESYDSANMAGRAMRNAHSAVAKGISSIKDTPMHPAIANVSKGIQRGLANPPQQGSTGFLGKAKEWLSSKMKIDPETENKLRDSKGFQVARAGINIGSGIAALHGLPGLGEHVATNTVRTMLARVPKAKESVKNRLLEGAKGLPESKLKRGLIDYAISPGYGSLRDIGSSGNNALNKTIASSSDHGNVLR